VLDDADADAYRADVSVGFGDLFESGRGQMNLYVQDLGAGYSAPGQTTFTDLTQYGGSLSVPITESIYVGAKGDVSDQDQGLKTTTGEINFGYGITDNISLDSGLRYDDREDSSALVPVTQEEGARTDGVVQLSYDTRDRWRGYGFVQNTLTKDDGREDNARYGTGMSYRITDRMMLDGEVSHGDLGGAARVGSSYLVSDATSLYLNYALENERTDNGLRNQRGNLVAGARTRLSDSTSVFHEERYEHADTQVGLTHATGVSLVPNERWNFGLSTDIGTLEDRVTGAEIERRAGGLRVGYGFQSMQLSSAVEYRYDESEALDGAWSDRTTWLFRNSFKYQLGPDWRLVGKFNYADSDSSDGAYYDGGYTEAVFGYAYRPVNHDRLNVLAKYTYFYNMPTTGQDSGQSVAAEFIQRSHVAAVDVTYDLTRRWSVGGKYAYRLGEVSLDREDEKFFDNDAHLYVVRSDLRFGKNWEGLLEGRILDMPQIDERRTGTLVTLYRYLGEHLKVGVGYNFVDFSDDLTDLDYDQRGVFMNIVGAM
jgi:lipopolysaccharide assembly outer membrane protein LptD (OstA)